jgi:hypothetical protein
MGGHDLRPTIRHPWRRCWVTGWNRRLPMLTSVFGDGLVEIPDAHLGGLALLTH